MNFKELVLRVKVRDLKVQNGLRQFSHQKALGFQGADQLEFLRNETFVFEFYLLQLARIPTDPDTETERKQLEELIKKNLTSNLTEKTPPTFDLEMLQQEHKSFSNYNLIHGAKNNDLELLEAAFAANADVDFIFIDDCALTIAVEKGYIDFARELIARNANVNIQVPILYDHTFSTPLIKAAQSRNLAMVQLLITHGAQPDTNIKIGGTALYQAIKSAFLDDNLTQVVEYLLETKQSNLNASCQYSLESPKETALQAAIKKGFVPIVKLLLKHGATRIPKDFELATRLKSTEVAKLLLDEGYKATPESLVNAIWHNNPAMIQLLLDNNLDIDEAKAYCTTPTIFNNNKPEYTDLIFYTAIGNLKEVERLIKSAVKVDEIQRDQQTALHMAARLGRTDIMRVLIEAGANVDAVDDFGKTPCMLAVQLGHSDAVEVLLQSGANVNFGCPEWIDHVKGNTALMLAVNAGDVVNVKKLLTSKKIDLTCKNEQGDTALTLAKKLNNSAINAMLELKLAEPSIDALSSTIRQKVTEFHAKSTEWFSIGNEKKAVRIQAAFDRASKIENAKFSMWTFLNYKDGNQESILEAFAYHRIGFFGKTTSQQVIEDFTSKFNKNFTL